MKKIILSLLLFLFLLPHSDGQNQDQIPKNTISAGYGFMDLNYVVSKFNDESWITAKTISGPFYLKWHYQISSQSSFGINTFYIHMQGIDTYHDSVSFSAHGYGINLHFRFVMYDRIRWLKPYLGLGFGFQDFFPSGNRVYDDIKHDAEFHGNGEITFGLQFLPITNWGCYVEVGAAETAFQLGIITKF